MKLLTCLMGLIFVLPAQAQFGLSRSGSLDLTCSLTRSAGKLPDGTPLFACATANKGSYSLGIAAIAMEPGVAAQAGSKLVLRFHCTVAQPKGVFLYGGETIGFETSTNPREKFFYAVGERNYGRCYFSTDRTLMSKMKLAVNRSAIILVPANAK